MNVWLLPFDKFIKVNRLKEVTNAMMFDSGNVPTSDGLFSTEIFGVSTKDRKETFAYIDLGLKFLNPKAYITLKRLNRNFDSVIYGTKKFVITNGQLVEDENGNTGMKWLYDNWEKLKFPKNDSVVREERVDLLSINEKDVLFTSKFLVIPAFYRDVNLKSAEKNPRVPEINDLYANIIRNVKIVRESATMDFVIASVTGKIQQLLVDIYNLLKEKIQGKSGYIRKYLMGKTVDYSSRVVITAAPYTSKYVDDQECNYWYTGVPLSHVCSEFTPFILNWVTRWFKNEMENLTNGYAVWNQNTKEREIVKLNNPLSFYNSEFIEEKLDGFVNNPAVRFDTIPLPLYPEDIERLTDKKGNVPCMGYIGKRVAGDFHTVKTESLQDVPGVMVSRKLTWTDIFYQAAVDVTSDKHVWISRYPITDYLGMYVSRVHVISTRDTAPMIVNGIFYKNYPVIDPNTPKKDMDSQFRDTINISAIYLPSIGGDFDGDQITCKSVFTQEANEECERIMRSKSNILTVQGTAVRGIGNEGVQTLYSMTAFR